MRFKHPQRVCDIPVCEVFSYLNTEMGGMYCDAADSEEAVGYTDAARIPESLLTCVLWFSLANRSSEIISLASHLDPLNFILLHLRFCFKIK